MVNSTSRPLASRRTVLAAGGVTTAAAALAACSGGSSDGGGGGDAPAADLEERGPITLAKGKDTTGKLAEFLETWNSEHPDEEVTLIELPESSDEQRRQMINNAQAKSDAYTVLGLDVIWTAEFAANQWVVELPQDKFPLDELIPATVTTATYFDKLYGVPFITNAELLFSRTDLLEAAGLDGPPESFEEMYAAIETLQEEDPELLGFGSQYSKYEGLTVQAAGLVASAGGELFDAEGKPHADSAEAVAGIQTVRDGFDKGFIPKEALTYKEEESRAAYQDGRLAFLQNWPYVWELAQAEDGSSSVNGKIVASLIPGLDGPGNSTLGGLNLGISAFAKNKGTAVDFIAFRAAAEQQKAWGLATAQAGSNAAIYEDADMLEAFPFLPQLKEAIDTGVARPAVVQYGEVTQAIQEAAYACFSGEKDAEPAMKDLQTQLTELE
ncbi:MAG: ABC transporter substrate-binding protein [Brachybacterium sp.]|uniref:ABC transporter substrate-binding protein n=1 Tax=Brachybacterium sp. TaxID=1891286 RepID=UPI003F8FED2B